MKNQPLAFFWIILLSSLVGGASSERVEKAVRDVISHGAIIECVKIGKPAVAKLLESLKDPSVKWEAKGRIGWALSDIFKEKKNQDPAFLDDLETLATNPDRHICGQTVRALKEFKHPRVRKILKNVAESHPDEYERGGALGTLVDNTDKDRSEIPYFRRFLSDKSPIVRARAAGALGRLGDTSGYGVAMESATSILSDRRKRRGVRREGLIALGYIGDKKAIPFLRGFYEKARSLPQSHEDFRLSGEAFGALLEIEYKSLITIDDRLSYLRSKFRSSFGEARWARWKLEEIDDLRIIEIFKEAAEDKNHPGHEEGLKALYKRGIVEKKWWK